MESYLNATAVSLYGGEGDDAFVVTPTSKNLGANFALNKTLTFDGGAGADSLDIRNDSNTSGNGYTVSGGQLRIASLFGFPSFTATFPHAGVEHTSVTAGPQLDFFSILETDPGTLYDLSGGPGAVNDDVYLGAQLNRHTDLIRGGVRVDGSGGGNDRVFVYNSADNVGRTLHIGGGKVGGRPGDDLFGPGGYLETVGVTGNVTITLGSGDDAVYAAPHPDTPYVVFGNGAAAGDALGLALAGMSDPLFTPGAAGAGVYTFAAAASVTYAGFEATVIDDVAPFVVEQSYVEFVPPSLVFVISEDVSGSLSVAHLELVHTGTGERVPPESLELAYDVEANTVVFTFPGLANGVLPAGDYSARLISGASDFFGNLMAEQTTFFFTPTPPLAGDYNNDHVVDLSDYDVWRLAFGGAVGIAGEGADGNADGFIDAADYSVWRDHLGATATSLAAMSISGEGPPVIAGRAATQETRVSNNPLLGIGRIEFQQPDPTKGAYPAPQHFTRHPSATAPARQIRDEPCSHTTWRNELVGPTNLVSQAGQGEPSRSLAALDLAFAVAAEHDLFGWEI